MSQFSPANIDTVGEKLIIRYIHSGNPEYHVASADWANGLLTLKAPHGLPIGTKQNVLLCPNFVGTENPWRDILAVPYEYTKLTSPNTNLSIVPQDTITVKVTKDDGTTVVPVNPTSTENNNNLDITKFHFEIPIGWDLANIPPIKKFRIKQYGYIKNNAQYRYTQARLLLDDGTKSGYGAPDVNIGFSFIQFLGIPAIPNSASTNAIYSMQDWVVDASTRGQLLYESFSQHFGRRGGVTNFVQDVVNETRKVQLNLPNLGERSLVGIIGVRTMPGGYTYMANGSLIEIYDLGGK